MRPIDLKGLMLSPRPIASGFVTYEVHNAGKLLGTVEEVPDDCFSRYRVIKNDACIGSRIELDLAVELLVGAAT